VADTVDRAIGAGRHGDDAFQLMRRLAVVDDIAVLRLRRDDDGAFAIGAAPERNALNVSDQDGAAVNLVDHRRRASGKVDHPKPAIFLADEEAILIVVENTSLELGR
jgi:hypothetical protein